MNIAIAFAVAAVLAVIASIVLTRASNRSALWNMAFGGLLALAVILGVLIAVVVLTRAAFPH